MPESTSVPDYVSSSICWKDVLEDSTKDYEQLLLRNDCLKLSEDVALFGPEHEFTKLCRLETIQGQAVHGQVALFHHALPSEDPQSFPNDASHQHGLRKFEETTLSEDHFNWLPTPVQFNYFSRVATL